MSDTATAPRASATVQAAIRKLDEFYDQGQKAWELWNAAPGKYARGVVKQHAAQLRWSTSQVFAARRFAETISAAELQKLQQLMRRSGRVISVCHARALVLVPQRKWRWKYAQRLLREKWSVRQLRAEIQRQFPPRGRGGRRFRLPPERTALLAQLQRMCAQFQRYSAGLAAPLAHAEATRLSQLPPSIVQAHEQALAAVAELNQQIAATLQQRPTAKR